MQDHAPARNQFADHQPPTWFEELGSGLSIRAHFVVSGNLRDVFPAPGPDGLDFLPFERAAWRVLAARGCLALLIHDPVAGLRLHEECDPRAAKILEEEGVALGTVAATPAEMAALVTRIAGLGRLPTALMLDYASTLLRAPRAEIDRLFVAVDRLARAAPPPRPKLRRACPPRNPVLWLVDRAGDLPEWFATGNAALRELKIGLPDLGDRIAYVASRAGDLHDAAGLDDATRHERVESLAVRTEGMTLSDLDRVVELARWEKFGLKGVGEALRSYRIGTTRNPWTSTVMRQRVRGARTVLERRVKGQPRAVQKTFDILVRSIMGLSGAQTSNRSARPRGVLFLVGPTGVGKTELAKSVAEVLFGDETAMQRFDMSEFMSDTSIGRLIGPPPGAPGHENGGELVNAVRARPFSVFLFDEIEKGHPRILDAFLQILDDGRLSDSRGETGYFSESLIIFTSNVGVVGGDRGANSGQNVLPSDSPEVLEEKLTKGVSDHFRYELKRPELMNRMGQNIVPFEFINARSADVIFEAVMRKVIAAVREEHGVEIELTEDARDQLLYLCTSELNDGGRGIGNRIESNFINPIARALFALSGSRTLRVTGVDARGRETELTFG